MRWPRSGILFAGWHSHAAFGKAPLCAKGMTKYVANKTGLSALGGTLRPRGDRNITGAIPIKHVRRRHFRHLHM
jgi:hypothetical protein